MHTPDLSKQYILVIDDEPDNLEVATYTLQLLYNARVLAVKNGLAALQAVSGEITLILCDLMMPGMNGYELLPKLREKTGVPIIALTANAMEHDRQRTLQAGFDGYIAKPFNVDTLALDIVSCLGDLHQTISGRQPSSPQVEGAKQVTSVSPDPLPGPASTIPTINEVHPDCTGLSDITVSPT